MKISCQSCGAKYNIADEKVRGKIVKIACKKCGARIEIDGREPAEQAQDQDETRVYDQAQPPAGAGAETWTVSVDDNDQRESTTAQILELLQQGVINADTFVWRDGMADWLPIRDVPELASALSHDGSASGYAASQPPAADPQPAYEAPAARAPSEHPAAAPLAAPAYPAPQIETAQAARLGGSRRGGAVDLFATQAAPEDEDVATSAPAAGAMGGGGMFGGAGMEQVSSGKPIGARNENSVLFSLSALTASGPTNNTAASVGGDDEKSGLIDIQKLAAAAKPGAKGDDRAKLDDIMNLGGGGAFGAALGAPILAPPPAAALEASTAPGAAEEKKGGKGMLFAVIGLGLVVVGLVVVLVLRGGGDDKTKEAAKSKDEKSEPSKKEVDKDKKAPGADPGSAKTGDTPPDPGAGGPIGQPGTAPSVKGTGAATGGTAKPGTAPPAGSTAAPAASKTGDAPPPGAKPGCKSLEECMGAPKDPPKDPPKPTGGGAEFDKGAATSSLKAVPYKDCGSGGPGKVSVTFSPSGSVAGASVTAGDYDATTKGCIAGRFRGAKVPAFSGDPKTVGWSINL